MSTDAWNPAQYEKFRAERRQPFDDLRALIRPHPAMRVIDLGCGTGELTALLAEVLPGSSVTGLDSSAAMLERAAARQTEHVRFQPADLREWRDAAAYDLVFSNAALQWVPDNEGLLNRILAAMRPGSQIAVQVPRNEGHPSHRIAAEIAERSPFRELLGGFVRRSEVLSLERYSELLHAHGFREQVCLEKIYGHELAETAEVVEWVKGTLLTAYLTRLDAPAQEAFLTAYRERLIAELGERRPYFYPFRRMLFWGQKGS
ncbi:MAG TPA: methyltransferase domain-containing protein [Stenomitos sp.]